MRHLILLLALAAAPAAAQDLSIPVLVPDAGLQPPVSSQRNGAALALKQQPRWLNVQSATVDTGGSPEAAAQALQHVLDEPGTVAAVGPVGGAQMLAVLPVAAQARIPLLTVSAADALTATGNPYVFRFVPDEATAIGAQLRYALDELHVRHPALVTQATAEGQTGRAEMLRVLQARGVTPASDDALDPSVHDMAPVLARAAAAGADALLLRLQAGPTVLLVQAAAASAPRVPVLAGPTLVEPEALASLQPAQLKGVCAETASSPVSGETPRRRRFTADYRAAFGADPDAVAVAQYDGTAMALQAISQGARTRVALTRALSSGSFEGVAMTYRSDGRGNMAHSAAVVCFDGVSRTPAVARHYDAR